MLTKYYVKKGPNFWSGRLDSNDNYDAFRWHQWIENIDLNDKNLKPFKGELGFAILGFKSDYGIKLNKGREGAKNGPDAIRKELANRPCRFTQSVKIFDAGDIVPQNTPLEKAQEALSIAVKRIMDLNLFPIILGGGHETAYGDFNGVLKKFKEKENRPSIGIINFDAHFDIRPYTENGGTSGTMFRQIYDDAVKDKRDFNYLVLGIQEYANTVDLFKTCKKIGGNYVLAKKILTGDYYSNIEEINQFIRKEENIYVTICTDVFSSAFAPGVSAPQPLGLDPESVIILLKHIISSGKVKSFNICEVSPTHDKDNVTASLASSIIFTFVTYMSKIYDLGYGDN